MAERDNNKALATSTAAGLPSSFSADEVVKQTLPAAVHSRCKGYTSALQAVDSGERTLATLRHTCGEEKTLALLKLHLLQLNELLNLGRPMGETLIDRMADSIAHTYYYLNMAEIHLVLDRGAAGHYGQVMMCNMATVMRWFAEYDTERTEQVVERNLAAHEQLKMGYEDKPRMSETKLRDLMK